MVLPLLLLTYLPLARAHMSIWDPGMFAFNGPTGCVGDDCDSKPVNPLGPDWEQDEWWFRGPTYRSALPTAANASLLPAGGSWTTEITCHKAWSSYGHSTTTEDEEYSCCPNSPGPYHADADAKIVNDTLIAGCALGIVDTMNLDDVTNDNIVIFTVQPDCVKQRVTSFDIPADMPACTGDYCICAWFWLANTGTGNFYMTGFYCTITGSTSTKKLATPKDPVGCKGDPSSWVAGAKRPLYVYNTPNNVVSPGNDNRPSYGPNWSFTIQGAQTDIFTDSDLSNSAESSAASAGGGSATFKAATAAATAVASHSSSATSSSTATAAAASVASSTSSLPTPYLAALVAALLLMIFLIALLTFRRRRQAGATAVPSEGGEEEKGLRRGGGGESSSDDGEGSGSDSSDDDDDDDDGRGRRR